MTLGNDLNGKHDGWEFSGLNIVWVETILDRIFWIGVIRVGIFRVRIVRVGVIRGGNFTRWNDPVGIIQGGNFHSTLSTKRFILLI